MKKLLYLLLICQTLFNSINCTTIFEYAEQGNLHKVKLLLNKSNVDDADDSDKTVLHWACRNGHIKIARYALEKGANIEAKNETGWTPLCYAAQKGHLDIVKLLLSKDANIKSHEDNKLSALHLAVGKNQHKIAQYLIEQGLPVDIKDRWKYTPLHWAARENHAKCVHLLIEHGANINAQDKYGNTPIFRAAEKGHDAIVQILLENGANKTIENKKHKTSAQVAQDKHHLNTSRIISSFSPTPITPSPSTSIMSTKIIQPAKSSLASKAASSKLNKLEDIFQLIINNNIPAIKHAIKQNKTVLSLLDSQKNSPLHHAVQHGNLEITKLLIEAGCDNECTNDEGNSPFHLAAQFGQKNIIKYFVDDLCEPNYEPNNTKLTPLYLAAQGNFSDIVQILLEDGAIAEKGFLSLNCSSQIINIVKEEFPKIFETQEDDLALLQTITLSTVSSSVTINPSLKKALASGTKKDLKKVLETGVSLQGSDPATGNNALHFATQSKHANRLVPLLLNLPNKEKIFRDAQRIHKKLKGNSKARKVGKLLKKGAKVILGKTIEISLNLAGSAVGVGPKIGTTLVDFFKENAEKLNVKNPFKFNQHAPELHPPAGLKINATNKEGKTPLHLAVEQENECIAWLLMLMGADPTIRDNKGRLPIYWAYEHNNNFLETILHPRPGLDNIYGIDTIVSKLKQIADHQLENPHGEKTAVSTAYKAPSLFLHGPHGTGKTSLAQGLALRLGYTFLPYSNATNIKELFEQAKEMAPTLIYINQINSNEQLNIIATEIKNLSSNDQIFTVGSSSSLKFISPETINTIRTKFETVLKTNKPDVTGRYNILKSLAAMYLPCAHISDELLYAIAHQTNNFSGTHLEEIIFSAGKHATERAAPTIETMDFEYALKEELIKHNHQSRLYEMGVNMDESDDEQEDTIPAVIVNSYGGVVRPTESFNKKAIKKMLKKGKGIHNRDTHKRTALHWATQNRSHETVAQLLRKGADPSAQDKWGNTPLHTGAINGDAQSIKLLLKNSDTLLNNKNSAGLTPLHIAILHNNKEVAQTLIRCNATITLADARSNTPLIYAAQCGRNSCIKMLYESGCDLNGTNANLETALHHATRKNHKSTIALLKHLGASVSMRDKLGRIPRYFARRNKRASIDGLLHSNLAKSPRFSDIIGNTEIINTLKDIMISQKKSYEFFMNGKKAPNTLLLVGPPGTGKTLSIRAFAYETQCNCFELHSPAASDIIRTFKQARSQTPCIILIDDIDRIGGKTSAGVTQLKHEMSQPNNQLIIVGKTNQIKELDRSIQNKFLKGKKINVLLPTQEERKLILQRAIGTIAKVYELGNIIEQLSKKTKNFSGRDITGIVEHALESCKPTVGVTRINLNRAFQKIKKQQHSQLMKS